MILDIPYVSQLEDGALRYHNDCGAACMAMLIRAYYLKEGEPYPSVDALYRATGQSKDSYLSVWQLRKVLYNYELPTESIAGLTIKDLRVFLQEKRPPIVLCNYKILQEAGLELHSTFRGYHFALLVGIDSEFVYLNDPLWPDEEGDKLSIPIDVFDESWGNFLRKGKQQNRPRQVLVPTIPLKDVEVWGDLFEHSRREHNEWKLDQVEVHEQIDQFLAKGPKVEGLCEPLEHDWDENFYYSREYQASFFRGVKCKVCGWEIPNIHLHDLVNAISKINASFLGREFIAQCISEEMLPPRKE